ncbi:Aldo/keto reductase [Periconia macrospinosa]|uniref:Aldo/keto reductase n=1 Tax=Periconia macrospinosa TaxID=97972 RepID=A0A2V1DB05_9PLEO|nr:Aldo/keto reductase [Periconia macrospinosa]
MSPSPIMTNKLHQRLGGGHQGPQISALGFGLMGLSSHAYGTPPSDDERFAILDRAHELGMRFWDSADLYGDNEGLVGKWFQRTGKRGDIFLATKFGFVKGGQAGEVDSSAEYCRRACEESLRVLGVEWIDLYWMHSANPNTPIEETVRAMAELQKEGKIKHIGLSGISSTTLRRASAITKIAAIQADYTVFSRDIEGAAGSNLLPTCRELGVSIVAATPLGRGILTTSFAQGDADKLFGEKDTRPTHMPRFQGENLDRNVELVKKFNGFAERKGCTVAQLALAWLIKQGEDIIPIPGTKKIKYLEENWGALDVELSDEEEKEIRGFGSENGFAGAAAPPQFLAYFYRDTVEE